VTRVLILGGTGEGAELARALAGQGGLETITSLAGRTREPAALPGEVRVGGFGGAAGLEGFLRERAIGRVIDATHPFAARISANAALASAAAGVPRLRLLRPGWTPVPGDRWHEVADADAAARLLPTLGRTALLTLGHRDLAAFARLDGVRLVVRTIEPPGDPPPLDALWLTARGPFRLDEERALLERHRIDVLVTKASGGAATYPKLAAARELGLPVVTIARPAPPPGPVVESVAAALAWLGQDQPHPGARSPSQ
jgi:precorrin-6A/cobalt-precorrin-6A reductase